MALKTFKLLILLLLCNSAILFALAPIAESGRFKPLEAKESKDFNVWQEQFEARKILQSSEPLLNRLFGAGGPLIALPSKLGKGKWIPLNALMVDVYDPQTQTWKPVNNFTLYDDALFHQLREEYRAEKPNIHQLQSLLLQGYEAIAGKSYQPTLTYPTILQLKAEAFYFQWPLVTATIVLYFIAFLFLLKYPQVGITFTALAFSLHTLVLLMRVYILQRPPVSNMFETVIYVPWIAVATGTLFSFLRKDTLPLLAAIAGSITLLIILKISKLDSSLENVQAVLNSQFWLSIHVLMIVGSYGVLIFSGILGHIYLLRPRSDIATTLLQSMYLGVGLLIAGTLLGGVWAAQSWGRFWDWDPKESWAFISSCLYLVIIHAYRFKKMGDLGLAIGSIIGLLAIGFTWYGVNYILGTGLHSYGFGQGGASWFYAFVGLEIAFIAFTIVRNQWLKSV